MAKHGLILKLVGLTLSACSLALHGLIEPAGLSWWAMLGFALGTAFLWIGGSTRTGESPGIPDRTADDDGRPEFTSLNSASIAVTIAGGTIAVSGQPATLPSAIQPAANSAQGQARGDRAVCQIMHASVPSVKPIRQRHSPMVGMSAPSVCKPRCANSAYSPASSSAAIAIARWPRPMIGCPAATIAGNTR